VKRYEKVHNPKHYNEHPSGVECIDIIEHMTFNSGTAVKYLWRAGLKPGEETIEDLKKALWYVGREIEKITKTLGKTKPPSRKLVTKKTRKRR
jgi:hypothetical protein